MGKFFCTIDHTHLHKFHQTKERFESIAIVTDASWARHVVSLLALGRGSEESRSHTAQVSLMIGGTTVCGSGGGGGQDGGSLR